MIHEEISVTHAISVLNRALKKDPVAIQKLVNTRVACNAELSADPSIQILKEEDNTSVGLLGIINGLFGSDHNQRGAIAANFEVVCPNDHFVPENATVRTTCEICKTPHQCGNLANFCDLRK